MNTCQTVVCVEVNPLKMWMNSLPDCAITGSTRQIIPQRFLNDKPAIKENDCILLTSSISVIQTYEDYRNRQKCTSSQSLWLYYLMLLCPKKQDIILWTMFYCIFFSTKKKKSPQVNYYGLVRVSVIWYLLIIHDICFMNNQTGLFNALHLLH